MGTWLGIATLLVSLVSAIIAFIARHDSKQSAEAAQQSAEAAQAVDHRARTPQLEIILSKAEPAPTDRVIYKVRNGGPQDLDSLIIYRPRPSDQITYQIASTDGHGGWANDEIPLGLVSLGQEARFTLCCGVAPELPEFRVLIECISGNETWRMTKSLPPPRGWQ